MRAVLQAFPPTSETLMIPGLTGLMEAITTPFLPARTVFEMPGPVIFTFTPGAPFEPFFTVTLICCLLPFRFRSFGVAASVSQISGSGFGFGVGGSAGAVTTVLADAVLLPGFVSVGV